MVTCIYQLKQGLIMKVKQLIKLLEKMPKDADVIAAWARKGIGGVDEVDSICINGPTVQINCESLFEKSIMEAKWGVKK